MQFRLAEMKLVGGGHIVARGDPLAYVRQRMPR